MLIIDKDYCTACNQKTHLHKKGSEKQNVGNDPLSKCKKPICQNCIEKKEKKSSKRKSIDMPPCTNKVNTKIDVIVQNKRGIRWAKEIYNHSTMDKHEKKDCNNQPMNNGVL